MVDGRNFGWKLVDHLSIVVHRLRHTTARFILEPMEDDYDGPQLSTLTWWLGAENARMSAFLLWKLRDDEVAEAAADEYKCPIRPSFGPSAAFQREAAVSLELIIKAVISYNLDGSGPPPWSERAETDNTKVGVPTTHDIPALWKQAGLPDLPREDAYRLLRFKSILIWSGRYAAPKSPEAWKKEDKAFRALEGPPFKLGELTIRNEPCEWGDFNRLFQMAKATLGVPYSMMRRHFR